MYLYFPAYNEYKSILNLIYFLALKYFDPNKSGVCKLSV